MHHPFYSLSINVINDIKYAHAKCRIKLLLFHYDLIRFWAVIIIDWVILIIWPDSIFL